MRVPTTALLIVIYIASGAFAQQREFRKWRMRDGRQTRYPMTVAEIDGRIVTLTREDSDRRVRVVIDGLSDKDQAYLREHFPEQMSPAESRSPSGATNESRSTETRAVRWPAPVVNDDDLDRWITFVRPTADELKWRNIRWHNNLASAQAEARRLQRPILLWTMNGNPCGET